MWIMLGRSPFNFELTWCVYFGIRMVVYVEALHVFPDIVADVCVCVCVPGRDILRVGVTLAGHQKKILNSVQMMRAQMNQIQSVEV